MFWNCHSYCWKAGCILKYVSIAHIILHSLLVHLPIAYPHMTLLKDMRMIVKKCIKRQLQITRLCNAEYSTTLKYRRLQNTWRTYLLHCLFCFIIRITLTFVAQRFWISYPLTITIRISNCKLSFIKWFIESMYFSENSGGSD